MGWQQCELSLQDVTASDRAIEAWRKDGMRGNKYYPMRAKPVPTARFFDNLAYFDQANFMISCSIHPQESKPGREFVRSDGLVESHAYSILDVQCVHGHRLVRLRNPWGQFAHKKGICWRGAWGVGAEQWAMFPEVAADLGYTSAGKRQNCGAEDDLANFWMAYEDFEQIFNT